MSSSGDFLTFYCKRTERAEIKKPLTRYIERHYGKEKASELAIDIEEVIRRRSEVVAVSGGGSSDTGKDIYSSYYRALSVMETRFPISRDADHAQVVFMWTTASAARRRTKQMNIHFEKASVLFNIAAVLSQKAGFQNRESQEGYKAAIQHFQEAAGTFGLAKEVALKVENPKPSDLTSDFLTLAEKLMLAQGQECVFWRAFKDKKSSSLLSKVSKHTSVLYSEALALTGGTSVKEEIDRAWPDLIQSKSWLFEAICQHHAAEDARSQEDIAIEISRTTQSIALLQKLLKNGKFLTAALPIYIKELSSAMTQRLHLAERDNASIYLKRVHPFNELPIIDGVQIVKPVMTAQLEGSNEHLFSDLIPEPITKALSRYSDMVDNLTRQEIEKIHGATDEAKLKCKQYELPEVLDAVSASSSSLLPDALKKELEEIETANGLIHLEELNEQIKALKANVIMELDKIEQTLDDDAAEDSKLREQHGARWTAATSASQNAGFKKLVASYRENLQTASNSDKVIEEKMTQNCEKLAVLTVQAVIANMPKLEAGIINVGDDEGPILVANIRNCLFQLDSLSAQRAALEDSLRELKNKDDLLGKIVATGVGSHEELFRTELEKYNPMKSDIEENLLKQKELLDYLTDSYNSFQQVYDLSLWRQQIDVFCKDMKTNITAFYDVRDNVAEGMKFYMNLKDAVDQLKQQSSDFVMSRKFDRDDRAEFLKAEDKQQQEALVAPPPPPPPAHSYSGSSAGYNSSSTQQQMAAEQTIAPPYQPHQQPTVAGNSPYDQMVESPNPYNPPPPPVQSVSEHSSPGYVSNLSQQQVAAEQPSAPPYQPPGQHTVSGQGIYNQSMTNPNSYNSSPPPPPPPLPGQYGTPQYPSHGYSQAQANAPAYPPYQSSHPQGMHPGYNYQPQSVQEQQYASYPGRYAPPPQHYHQSYPYQGAPPPGPPPPGSQYYPPPNYGHPHQQQQH